jgi:hypothetical protein
MTRVTPLWGGGGAKGRSLPWALPSPLLRTACVRAHRLPQATKAFTFRRGTYPASVYSLAFSPAGGLPGVIRGYQGHQGSAGLSGGITVDGALGRGGRVRPQKGHAHLGAPHQGPMVGP